MTINNTDNCISCGKPVPENTGYLIRLNNHDQLNSDSDKWGRRHKDCLTADDVAELDGSKYFGEPVYDR